jgi:hypothetical protein
MNQSSATDTPSEAVHPATTSTVPGLVAPPPSDPQAIERAREAVRQKLREPQAPSQAAPLPPPAAVRTPAPAVTLKPTPLPPPPVPKPATPAVTSTVTPVPAPMPKPTRTPTPAPVVKSSAPVFQPMPAATPTASSSDKFMPLPAPANSEADQKAEEALRQQMGKKPSSVANEEPTMSASNQHPQSRPPTPKQRIRSLPAIGGPPTGLSSAKEQKLAELLEQYKADQLTPDQYHAERAKILAGP